MFGKSYLMSMDLATLELRLLAAVLAAKDAMVEQDEKMFGTEITAVFHDEIQYTDAKRRTHRHHNKKDRWR